MSMVLPMFIVSPSQLVASVGRSSAIPSASAHSRILTDSPAVSVVLAGTCTSTVLWSVIVGIGLVGRAVPPPEPGWRRTPICGAVALARPGSRASDRPMRSRATPAACTHGNRPFLLPSARTMFLWILSRVATQRVRSPHPPGTPPQRTDDLSSSPAWRTPSSDYSQGHRTRIRHPDPLYTQKPGGPANKSLGPQAGVKRCC